MREGVAGAEAAGIFRVFDLVQEIKYYREIQEAIFKKKMQSLEARGSGLRVARVVSCLISSTWKLQFNLHLPTTDELSMPPPPPPTATTSARPRAPPTIIDLKSVISTRQPLTVDDSHFDQTRSHINRFVKCLEDWAEVHQSELVEEEQAHFRAVAEGQAEVRRLKGEIEGVRGSVEKIIDGGFSISGIRRVFAV